jgi:hypothetical protein
MSIELHPTIVAWVKAAQAATAEIKRLEEIRDRAIGHIQDAMGDNETATYQNKPAITWAWSKPAQRLDRKKLEEHLGPEEFARFLVDSKPARPFRIVLDGEAAG